jgi:hypothetical protein
MQSGIARDNPRDMRNLLPIVLVAAMLRIATADPKATCDAEKLADEGRALLLHDKFADALKAFEKSLACKPDPMIVTLALTAACKGADAPNARKYYKLATDIKHRDKVVAHCLKNNIDPTK